MPHLQKLGGIAAFINVAVAIATLAVATILIGFTAMSDPSKLAELAVHNPAPLIIQDGLKFVSAAISIVLILALANYLQRDTSTLLSIASGFGFFSVFCLVVNATLSLYAISHATVLEQEAGLMGGQLSHMIGILAMAVLFCDGLWYLLISWAALKSQKLPKRLCYLSLGIGAFSLVPPLGIIVLLLGIVWSVWIGRVLLREEQAV
jgi:succinate dehydrogenase/fumarate reductase cytochrome b subunit